jgi:hypothetical protein
MLMTAATTAWGLAMAKKARVVKKAKRTGVKKKAGARKVVAKKAGAKKSAAKKAAAKKTKVSAKPTKRPKAPSPKKVSAAKPSRKILAPKKSDPIAAIPPAAQQQSATPASAPVPAHESLSHRIGSAIKAVVDTLADAEQLHRRLDPDPSKDVDPE